MKNYIDAILFVPDFAALVAYLDEYHPDMLARTENGELTQPPEINAFARTPATQNGNALMVYARLVEEEADEWRNTPHMEVLVEAPYAGAGTGKALFDAVFADPDLAAKYDSVHSRASYQVEDGEGGTMTVTPPAMFGMLAGA